MIRHGKIARLPRAIREELNARLADNELGAPLVAWLNSLPEVQTLLAAQFKGHPITEQNLSEWRRGGFADWERHQEARDWVEKLVENSEDLEAASGSVLLADRAAIPIMLALDDVLSQVAISVDADDQREAVLSVAQQLTQLRRATHEAERLRLEKERWAAKKDEMRRAAIIQAHHYKHLDLTAPDPNQSKSIQVSPSESK